MFFPAALQKYNTFHQCHLPLENNQVESGSDN